MLLVTVFIGFAMLTMGRQFFWIVVSGLGFILGINYASQFIQGSVPTILLVSLGIGAVGALLAFLLQRAAASLAGFLAGWYLTTILIQNLKVNLGEFSWAVALMGGIIGVILIALLFDWSLILLSTTAGAALIVDSMRFAPKVNNSIFIILIVLGFLIQGILLAQEKNDFS